MSGEGNGLVIDGARVVLGGRSIVDGISFRAAAGEVVIVIGPNGAGKTTLLRAIAGLVPVAGRISHNGEDLSQLPPRARARCVSYLPQGHVTHWPIRARDAVAIGRVPHGAEPSRLSAADAAAVERALAAVDAHHLADRPITELSGGERARVMLARAIAVEAPVLLADEAVAALDPGHQLGVMQLLRDIAAEGRIVLATLHDLTLAARFATRVIVLDRGRIAGDGPAAATLGNDLIDRVFGIEIAHLQHAGQSVLLPWSTREQWRR